MKPKRAFPTSVLHAIENSPMLGVRAGTDEHRFLGIWAVVVAGRIFVRSWTLKPTGWNRKFLTDPRGTIQIDGRSIPVRARRTTGERMLKAVDAAYAAKYHTPASRKWVRGLNRGRRRASTTELTPR